MRSELFRRCRTRRWAAAALAAALAVASLPAAAQAPANAARAAPGAARTITWEDLVPKDWDPYKPLRGRNPGAIAEGSAGEQAMMRELREIWDNAPTRSDLEGSRLRLPGYVVPLDGGGGQLKEFLLVPYFGACIHSPPPPANQIVHVTLSASRPLRSMDVVWVSGALSTRRQDSPMGMSGYAMKADTVDPYR